MRVEAHVVNGHHKRSSGVFTGSAFIFRRHFLNELQDGGGQPTHCIPHGKGLLVDSDGSTFEGDFKHGVGEGSVVCKRHGKIIYEGEWSDDLHHGKGHLTYQKILRGVGNLKKCYDYTGAFTYGEYDGAGVLSVEDFKLSVISAIDNTHTRTLTLTSRYDGNFKGGIYDGDGTLKTTRPVCPQWPLGYEETYVGSWKDGKYHGQGSLTSSDGSKYEGDFQGGLKHSIRHGDKGIILRSAGSTDKDGNKYTGQFHMDKKHGQGTMIYACGDKYQGSWVKDCRHGIGILESFDANPFANPFRGHGYKGGFKDNLRHGRGVLYDMKYCDGHVVRLDHYVDGHWVKDVIEGLAFMHYSKTSVLTTCFVQGRAFYGYRQDETDGLPAVVRQVTYSEQEPFDLFDRPDCLTNQIVGQLGHPVDLDGAYKGRTLTVSLLYDMRTSFFDRMEAEKKLRLAEEEKTKAALACSVCFTKTKECLFVPCGHQCVCAVCAEKIQTSAAKCPICRAVTQSWVKVYN